MSDDNQISIDEDEDARVDRRVFLEVSTGVAAVAASWWGVTAKVDAMDQQDLRFYTGGSDPANQPQNYAYDY